ncbi:MAG: hypothetical protein ACYDB8_00530 [Acidiferrobacterales bacterium]
MTIKTILVDGDKGGVGKSLVTRAIVDMYLHAEEAGIEGRAYTLAVYDADRRNPDVCGHGGYTPEGNLILAELAALDSEAGWIDFGNKLEPVIAMGRSDERDVRIIVSMPAQIGQVFDGSVALVNTILRELNALPVWVLARTRESVTALEERIRAYPAQYASGVAVRNLFFGDRERFAIWETSAIRRQQVTDGLWADVILPEMNDLIFERIGRTPFRTAAELGTQSGPLGWGEQTALAAWRHTAWDNLRAVEHCPPQSRP